MCDHDGAATVEPRFRLEAIPATLRARLEHDIRARHRERDRTAKQDPAYSALRARAFIVMGGEELLGVWDPVEDGATLDWVIGRTSDRRHGDFAVFVADRIVAVARGHRGRHTINVFEDPTKARTTRTTA